MSTKACGCRTNHRCPQHLSLLTPAERRTWLNHHPDDAFTEAELKRAHEIKTLAHLPDSVTTAHIAKAIRVIQTQP